VKIGDAQLVSRARTVLRELRSLLSRSGDISGRGPSRQILVFAASVLLASLVGCGGGDPPGEASEPVPESNALMLAGVSIGMTRDELFASKSPEACGPPPEGITGYEEICEVTPPVPEAGITSIQVGFLQGQVAYAKAQGLNEERFYEKMDAVDARLGDPDSYGTILTTWWDERSHMEFDSRERDIVLVRSLHGSAEDGAPESPAAEAPQPAIVAAQTSDATACEKGPTIKGLCLGMPLEAAVRHAEQLLGVKLEGITAQMQSETDFNAEGVTFVWATPDLISSNFPVALRGERGVLKAIIFSSGPVIGKLFNANDQSPQAFVQSFVDAYSIPEMEGSTEPYVLMRQQYNMHHWTYRDQQAGFEIVVAGLEGHEWKAVMLSSTVPAAQHTFD